MKKGIGFILAALVILLSLPLAAQDHSYKVKVNRFYDYISVRDGDGNFVWNLKPEDFIVFVNGKEVEIDSLDPVKGLKADAVEWKQYERAVERKEEVQPPAPPKHIIIVFDVFNSGPFSIKEAKKTAKELLKSIPATDKVSVYEYNGTLKLMTPAVVEGPESAKKVIDKIASISRFEFQSSVIVNLQSPRVNFEYQQKMQVYQDYLRALRSLAFSTAGQTLPKRFLLFGEGPNTYVPMKTLANEYSNPDDMEDAGDPTTDGSKLDASVDNSFSRMMVEDARVGEVASLENYMSGTDAKFYTVRRGFNQPPSVLGVEQSEESQRDQFENPQNSSFTQIAQDNFQHRLGHLANLASMTRGKFYNSGISNERLVSTLMDEMGNYYQIFFKVPEDIEKDGFNNIKIELRNQDYDVTHKKGFFGKVARELLAKSKAEKVKKKVRTDGSVGDLAWQNKVFFIPEGKSGKALYYLNLEDDQIRQKSDGTAQLEVVVISKDPNGQDIERVKRTFSSKEKTGGWLVGEIPLTAKGGSVYLSIRDKMTGKSSRVDKRLSTRVSATTSLQLAEPIFMRKDKSGSLEEWSAKEKAKPLSLPLEGVPAINGVCAQGEMVTAYIILSDIKELDDSVVDNFMVTFGSKDAQGKEYLLMAEDEEVLLNKAAGQIIYRAQLPLGCMPYASGTIEIDISNTSSNQSLITRVPFQIEDFQKERVAEVNKDEEKVMSLE